MRVQQTSVKIHQDARESSRKKDGTYPVRLIIRHNGKPAPVTTPYSFLKQDWNSEKNRARGTVENSGRINEKLKWMKLQADNLIEDERQNIAGISASSLATMIKLKLKQVEKDFKTTDKAIERKTTELKGQNQSVLRYAEKVVKPTLKGLTTRLRFMECLRAGLKMINRSDIQLAEINTRLLNKMIDQCNIAGHSPRTIHRYWGAFKNVVRQAIKDEYFPKEFDPFRWVDDKPGVPLRSYKAINPKVVLDIFDLDTIQGSALWHAQRVMMVSWFGRGIPFCDLAALKVRNVVDGRIKYRRKKTGSHIDLKILPAIEQIMQDYTQDKQPDDYLFPFGMELPEAPKGKMSPEKREEIEKQHIKDFHRYQTRRRRLNIRFRKLAKIAGHDVKGFSPYIIRHTFATFMRDQGVSASVIGELLGHTDGRSVYVYLDKSDPYRLDQSQAEALGIVAQTKEVPAVIPLQVSNEPTAIPAVDVKVIPALLQEEITVRNRPYDPGEKSTVFAFMSAVLPQFLSAGNNSIGMWISEFFTRTDVQDFQQALAYTRAFFGEADYAEAV